LIPCPIPALTSVNSANTVTINGITYSLANPYDFAYPNIASGSSGGLGIAALAGWYGTSVLETRFGATDGDQTTGGRPQLWVANSSNRALGLLATSTTGAPPLASGSSTARASRLNRMNLQFTGEVWRQSNLPKTLQFYYFVDRPGRHLPHQRDGLAARLECELPHGGRRHRRGGGGRHFVALNQTNLSVLDQTITNWPPGAALWLVWQMTDSTGKAQGLAIDNLSFSASVPLPVPLSVQIAGTNLFLNWPGVAGQTYQLEYKNNLTDQAVGSPVDALPSPTTPPPSPSGSRHLQNGA
jgi:hypothetical protein